MLACRPEAEAFGFWASEGVCVCVCCLLVRGWLFLTSTNSDADLVSKSVRDSFRDLSNLGLASWSLTPSGFSTWR